MCRKYFPCFQGVHDLVVEIWHTWESDFVPQEVIQAVYAIEWV